MELVHIVVLLIAASIVNGSEQFRPDYEYHASAGGWFKFHKVPATWHDARLMCHLEGLENSVSGTSRRAVLASPINVDVSDVMQNIINKIRPSIKAYTGVSNLIVPVIYNSIEGVPLSSMPVRTEDMFYEEYSSKPHCVRLVPQEGLVAGSCNDDLPYICFKNKTAQHRITECGTVDTDYQYDNRSGHCYKFHKYSLPWTLAYMTCVAEGGQLAVINSNAEDDIIKELFAKYPPSSIRRGHTGLAHVGFYDWNKNNEWRTVNGQSLEEAGFANWTSGRPQSVGQYYGSMNRTGQLYDTLGKHSPFICEKHPNNVLPVPNNA